MDTDSCQKVQKYIDKGDVENQLIKYKSLHSNNQQKSSCIRSNSAHKNVDQLESKCKLVREKYQHSDKTEQQEKHRNPSDIYKYHPQKDSVISKRINNDCLNEASFVIQLPRVRSSRRSRSSSLRLASSGRLNRVSKKDIMSSERTSKRSSASRKCSSAAVVKEGEYEPLSKYYQI